MRNPTRGRRPGLIRDRACVEARAYAVRMSMARTSRTSPALWLVLLLAFALLGLAPARVQAADCATTHPATHAVDAPAGDAGLQPASACCPVQAALPVMSTPAPARGPGLHARPVRDEHDPCGRCVAPETPPPIA